MSADWSERDRQRGTADVLRRIADRLEQDADVTNEVMRAILNAHSIMVMDSPALYYARALVVLDVEQQDITAAIAKITAGDHPDDSFAGRIRRYHGKAAREAAHPKTTLERATRCDGEAHALAYALKLIGCVPSKDPGQ